MNSANKDFLNLHSVQLLYTYGENQKFYVQWGGSLNMKTYLYVLYGLPLSLFLLLFLFIIIKS